MDTEQNSPISDSQHHNRVPDDDKKPNTNKFIFIIIAFLVFTMGLGAVFFLAMSNEQQEQQMEEAATVADEE